MSDWDKILDFLEYDNTQKSEKTRNLEGHWKNSGKNNFLKFSTY